MPNNVDDLCQTILKVTAGTACFKHSEAVLFARIHSPVEQHHWEELATERMTRVSHGMCLPLELLRSGNYSGGGQIDVEQPSVLPLEIRTSEWRES